MRIIEGELQQIIQAGLNDAHADDYVLIRLTDSHAVLDVMSKLRAVYPNVLHLEKPGLNPEKKHINASATLKRDELELFADFYQQMLGHTLTEPQQALLEQTVKELREQGE